MRIVSVDEQEPLKILAADAVPFCKLEILTAEPQLPPEMLLSRINIDVSGDYITDQLTHANLSKGFDDRNFCKRGQVAVRVIAVVISPACIVQILKQTDSTDLSFHKVFPDSQQFSVI